MKKVFSVLLIIFMIFMFVGCNGLKEVEYHTSGFDGDFLYVNINENTYLYEKIETESFDFSKEKMIDSFVVEIKVSETWIDGREWMVYSAKEYPDLKYVIVNSAIGNTKLIYRAVK